ncbi:MAG TPA: 16S rRNA (cytosine(967)-C(5))-methyltransferase RsmB [Patescibacteria group bacterium]|nr:16S rRNA (cytosine(967)-C(5))-methyltransferase RsmB [Patescibacteria group bacterium]
MKTRLKSSPSQPSARELALKIINETDINGAYANIALTRFLKGPEAVSDLDRRFITELVYGVVRAGATLDWILGRYVDRPVGKIPPVIRNILRLGLYQLLFLSRIPPSAACNQAVELAKKYGHAGTVKFVNAVLRNVVRSPEKAVYPARSEDPAKYLALEYFHPEWLIRRWRERLGEAACEELCRCNNQIPPLSLRTNTLKIQRDQLLTQLANEGVSATASLWTPEGILCHEHQGLNQLSPLQTGLCQVQDESSMLVAHVLAPQPGETIIDACSAPGGKTTHIAALMNNQGRVIATDLHEHKLKLTMDNANRLGLDIIQCQTLDAAVLHESFAGQADRVLVDAPCSGLGVLRRKPDSRWRKDAALLSELPPLQLSILSSCAHCIKPGGVVVYSTCTTEPEENEAVVQKFLSAHSDFYLEPAGSFLPVRQRPEEMLQLWPHLDGVDGFFIARLRRR